MLGGLVWAVAQPYRIVFLDPDGKGLYDYLVQPPLLVALVGLRLHGLRSPPGSSRTSSGRSDGPES